MIAEKQKRSNIGVGIGIVLEIAGRVMLGIARENITLGAIGGVTLLVGVVFFIWGCMSYAEAKGYSALLGLLGLFSCVGLLILIILPDKNKDGGPTIGSGPNIDMPIPPQR